MGCESKEDDKDSPQGKCAGVETESPNKNLCAVFKICVYSALSSFLLTNISWNRHFMFIEGAQGALETMWYLSRMLLPRKLTGQNDLGCK